MSRSSTKVLHAASASAAKLPSGGKLLHASAPPDESLHAAPDESLPPTSAEGSVVEIVPSPERDPLSPLHRQVLGLFRGPLADVRFPDVDRSALDRLVEAVVQAQHDVESHERGLDGARQRLREAVAVLGATTSRALAYARIYAEGQPELSAIVADVRDYAVTRPRDDEAAPKKRGRPRKDASTVELIPTDPTSGGTPA